MAGVEQRANLKHHFDPSILRQYDIRGVIGETLTVTDCYFVGRAFGTLVKRRGGQTVVVCFDGRETSPNFADRLRKGLLESGIDVVDIGLGPTPMTYFAMQEYRYDAAVMVTGSHSPIHHNGIKMAMLDGPFYGDAIQEIGTMARNADYTSGYGTYFQKDVRKDYVARMLKDLTVDSKDLTVAWDAGNGAAGAVLRSLTDGIPGTHHLLYDTVDAKFPNHHPDPTVAENLVDLQKLVLAEKCDVGIAFDGDGDRIGAVGADGNIIWADMLMAVYAKDVLSRHPAATIIGDVKCSRVMYDEIENLGGKPVMWITGHSLIKAKMKETNSPLGGELAGHICFADHYYGFDDGLYCAIRLLNLIAAAPEGLAGLVKHLPEMKNTPEIRFEVPAERKFEIAPEIQQRLEERQEEGVAINDIDGVRVTTSDGWWLMRPSNTESVLTIRAEAFSSDGLERLKSSLAGQLALSGVSSPFDD